MSEGRPYFVAFMLAAMAFSASGGIHASEEAVRAEEGKPPPAALPAAADVRIPFANSGGIRDWQPDGSEALYIQDSRGRWYRATLFAPCFDLPYSDRVAFLTRGNDVLDKFSSVLVRGKRCQFSTLVPSAPPPGKAKARKSQRGS